MPSSTSIARLAWHGAHRIPALAALDGLAALTAAVLLAAIVLAPWMAQSAAPAGSEPGAAGKAGAHAAFTAPGAGETVLAGYAGVPWYYRSDVKLKRDDGTDLELKRLGWDGDAFYFPIDGGGRVVRWSGSLGFMVDFLHNKAIARLGRGAHGRRITNGIVEEVEATGTLKDQPAPERVRLTDLFERLEFTHGHNVLLLTGMARLAPLSPRIRPYLGLGAGVAVPHVEAWFAGEDAKNRTNEYQYAGPAAQLVAGIEVRSGRGSYFIEYKFIWASISAALTGDHSWSFKKLDAWRNVPRWLLEPFAGLMELPGDIARQIARWWSGSAEDVEGSLETTLISHQVMVGAGYVWPRAGAAP